MKSHSGTGKRRIRAHQSAPTVIRKPKIHTGIKRRPGGMHTPRGAK